MDNDCIHYGSVLYELVGWENVYCDLNVRTFRGESLVQYNKKWECPDHDKGCRGWQNMCKNLTEIDGFLSFLS